MCKRICITGANGFVGKALCAHCSSTSWNVCAAVRTVPPKDECIENVHYSPVGDIDSSTDWSESLHGVDTLVHLAARVHVLHDTEKDPLALFRRVNLEGTEHLARQAVECGVRRLIFLSSVKIHGEGSSLAYIESDRSDTLDAYAQSKMEAESALHRIAKETGLEVVIIRPPLVYGPGVKANFLRLLGLAQRHIPLPLGMVHNRRSMIFLDNLISAIMTCVEHPDAAGESFLVSDGVDLSTAQLVQTIGHHMRSMTPMIPVPVGLLRLAGKCLGKSGEIDRVTGSLTVNTEKIHRILHWTPPFSLDQGIEKTVNWYLNHS